MPYDSITSLTDDLQDNLATYQNEKKTAIDHLMSASAYASYVQTQSMTGNVTLTDSDFPIQSFSPTAARDLTMPTVASTNHAFYVMNRSVTYDITVKNAGTTTIGTVAAERTAVIISDGANGWYLVGGEATAAGGGSNSVCDGRLTLESGVPVSTTDQTAKTTVYFTPFIGNKIALYDGSSAWDVVEFSEISVAVPSTTNTPFDVFCYNNAGTATLETVNWTNGTTRATAITYQNGVLVKSGATTRRYIGTGRTTGTSGQCEMKMSGGTTSPQKIFLWNLYNQVQLPVFVYETTDTWNYTTLAYRQLNGSANNQFEFVVGVADKLLNVLLTYESYTTSGALDAYAAFGLDQSTAVSSSTVAHVSAAVNTNSIGYAVYNSVVAAGYHYLALIEYGRANMVVIGDAGLKRTGAVGTFWC